MVSILKILIDRFQGNEENRGHRPSVSKFHMLRDLAVLLVVGIPRESHIAVQIRGANSLNSKFGHIVEEQQHSYLQACISDNLSGVVAILWS